MKVLNKMKGVINKRNIVLAIEIRDKRFNRTKASSALACGAKMSKHQNIRTPKRRLQNVSAPKHIGDVTSAKNRLGTKNSRRQNFSTPKRFGAKTEAITRGRHEVSVSLFRFQIT